MSLKDQILNRIKSISDPKLLHELDAWIRQAEERNQKKVNETEENYHTESTVKNRGEKGKTSRKLISGVDYLAKIAEQGGVKGIDDPVEWQKKERQDRTLTIS